MIYNVENAEKYLKNQGLSCYKIINEKEIKCSKIGDLEKEEKIKVCYTRVSSIGQKEDLERQKKLLKDKYPKYHLIGDSNS